MALIGLPQGELADKLGIKPQMLRNYKYGRFQDIGYQKAMLLSQLSGIPHDQIDFSPTGNK